MNHRRKTDSAFTIIELLVAIGILAIVISFSSVIFKLSIDAHRTAIANAEIMQKLRAITNQLNSDFRGLRKDGEIFVVWVAKSLPAPGPEDNDLDGFERFDRIMFFADGDFQSYRASPVVRGNLARIFYMLAKRRGVKAERQRREDRILARTQHILTVDTDPLLADFILDPNVFGGSDQQWYEWHNRREYDRTSLDVWRNIGWVFDPCDPRGLSQPCKQNILSVITDIRVPIVSDVNESVWGTNVSPSEPNSIHMLLCEGVGEFKIQGWSDAQRRWIPEVDPDGDGDFADTDFFLAPGDVNVPGVLYPYPPNGAVQINNIDDYPVEQIDEAHFDAIPGLGRALKFTFTLYDSKGVIKTGRTFTHIVYLGS